MFVGNGTNALVKLPGPTQRNSPIDVAKDPTILALLKYVPRGKYMCQLEKIIGDKQIENQLSNKVGEKNL